MRAGATSLGLAIAGMLVATGCSVLPGQVDCGDVDPVTCARLADEILARARAQEPNRRVVSLVIRDEVGSYDLTFDDGTGVSAIVD